VPLAALDTVLATEAERLRAPNVTAQAWTSALAAVRRRTPAVPDAQVAAIHGLRTPGVAPEAALAALGRMPPSQVAAELAARVGYEHATLVVVSPLPLDDAFARASAPFQGLPRTDRRATVREPGPALTPDRTPSSMPGRVVTVPRGAQEQLALAIPGTPAARWLALALCEALSGLRPAPGEPKGERFGCRAHLDVRRPLLFFAARGPRSADEVLRARVTRLLADQAWLEHLTRIVANARTELASPLALARTLASAEAPTHQDAPAISERAGITPRTAAEVTATVREWLDGPRLVRLEPEPKP
jgi:hypothetical protein